MTLLQILKTISRSEWRFFVRLVLGVMIIVNLPLLYGWLNTPSGAVFTGIHFALPNDWFVYYSYLEQATQGHWLFFDLFTAEVHRPVLNIFWLGVGLVGKFFGLSGVVAFNLVKTALIPIFYLVAYLFLACLFADSQRRKVSLVLLSFASGLGTFLVHYFIIYPKNVFSGQFHWPMDLWVPESNTFFTLYTSPHFIASLTLLLLVFLLTLIFVQTVKFRYSFGAGLSALVLFSFHPFHVLTVFGVVFVYFLSLLVWHQRILWPLLAHYFVLLIFSAPAVFYYSYLIQTDFVMRQKALQNITPTTPFLIMLISYGLLLPLALAGFYFLVKNKNFSFTNQGTAWLLVVGWAVVQLLLIYAPVNFQRRLTEGLHFPLAVLTTVGLFGLGAWLSRRKNRLSQLLFTQRLTIIFVVGALLISSTLFLLAVDFVIYQNRAQLAYLEPEIIEAVTWLKQTDAGSIVLNIDNQGVNLIPAYAGRRVYVGHGVETPYYLFKQQAVAWFFSHDRAEPMEKDFLAERQIDYIFYSPLEKSLGSYNPAAKSYLEEVYSNSQVQIYQVL